MIAKSHVCPLLLSDINKELLLLLLLRYLLRQKGSTSNVVFVYFNKLQLLYPIFSYCSLILDEIEAENFLLKRNGGVNSINAFTDLKKRKFRFLPRILRILEKIKTGYKKPSTKTVTFVWPRQSNKK